MIDLPSGKAMEVKRQTNLLLGWQKLATPHYARNSLNNALLEERQEQ